MEEYLDELKGLVDDNKNFEIYYEINYLSKEDKWGIDIWSPCSEYYIFSEYGKDIVDLIEMAIKKLRGFIYK